MLGVRFDRDVVLLAWSSSAPWLELVLPAEAGEVSVALPREFSGFLEFRSDKTRSSLSYVPRPVVKPLPSGPVLARVNFNVRATRVAQLEDFPLISKRAQS